MFLASAYLAGILADGGIAAPALLRCRRGDGKRLARGDAEIARGAAIVESSDSRSRG